MPTYRELREGDIVWAKATGSQAVILNIFKSGRLDVQILEPKGHHKKGDRLVWNVEMVK